MFKFADWLGAHGPLDRMYEDMVYLFYDHSRRSRLQKSGPTEAMYTLLFTVLDIAKYVSERIELHLYILGNATFC